MQILEPSSSGPERLSNSTPVGERPRHVPDCGTLGPIDLSSGSVEASSSSNQRNAIAFGPILAVCAGVLFAVFVASIGSAHAAWTRFSNLFTVPADVVSAAGSSLNAHEIDQLPPQKQAETLLEEAISHSGTAVDQISSRSDRWPGKVKWNPQIATLTTAALNSSDARVRVSGIEVELAAYGLAKNTASLDYLLRTAESRDHARRTWALWALGLMGNRGIGVDRVTQALTAHLQDSNEDSRRWAVQGLALVASDSAIAPLLRTMHDDRSPAVRERAACALAEAGMFTDEQRFSAVPQLLNDTDDPSLDARTHVWAFQALADITHQRLPNDAAEWRSWYNSNRSESAGTD